jgi:hypothetical protein
MSLARISLSSAIRRKRVTSGSVNTGSLVGTLASVQQHDAIVGFWARFMDNTGGTLPPYLPPGVVDSGIGAGNVWNKDMHQVVVQSSPLGAAGIYLLPDVAEATAGATPATITFSEPSTQTGVDEFSFNGILALYRGHNLLSPLRGTPLLLPLATAAAPMGGQLGYTAKAGDIVLACFAVMSSSGSLVYDPNHTTSGPPATGSTGWTVLDSVAAASGTIGFIACEKVLSADEATQINLGLTPASPIGGAAMVMAVLAGPGSATTTKKMTFTGIAPKDVFGTSIEGTSGWKVQAGRAPTGAQVTGEPISNGLVTGITMPAAVSGSITLEVQADTLDAVNGESIIGLIESASHRLGAVPGTVTVTTSGGGSGGSGSGGASPDGFYVPTNGSSITMEDTSVWTISSTGGVLRNGAAPTTPDYTANVKGLLKLAGVLYQVNTSDQWYAWNTVNANDWAFVASGDPRVSGGGGGGTAATPPGPVATQILTGASLAVSALLQGLHAYRYPDDKETWDGYNPSAAPTFSYKVQRNVNFHGCFWREIETSAGTYDWTWMDKLVNSLPSGGKVLFCLGIGVPAFYATDPSQPSGYPAWNGSNSQLTSGGVTGAVNLCLAMLARYGGKILGIEIWNEPATDFSIHAGHTDVDYYASSGTNLQRKQAMQELQKTLYNAIKPTYPACEIIGPGFVMYQGPGGSDESNMKAYYLDAIPSGGTVAQYTDAVAGHLYPYDLNPQVYYDRLKVYRNVRDAIGSSKKIHCTETGMEGTSMPGGDTDMANSIKRRALIAALLGYETICWYSYEDPANLNALGNTTVSAALSWVAANVAGNTFTDGAILVDGRVWAHTFAGADLVV